MPDLITRLLITLMKKKVLELKDVQYILDLSDEAVQECINKVKEEKNG